MAEYCPRCGNQRTGSFRFCRSCQFDFDSVPDPLSVGPPQYPPGGQAPLHPPPASPAAPSAWTSPDLASNAPPSAAAPRRPPLSLLEGIVVVAILLVIGFGAVLLAPRLINSGTATLASPTPTPTPSPSAAATATPSATTVPMESPTITPDPELAAACTSIAEFRKTGDLIADASSKLGASYSTWEKAATKVLVQLRSFLDASDSLTASGPYGEWYVHALSISQNISQAFADWDRGVANGNARALDRGNQAMQAAADETDAMNTAAAAWEWQCQ